VLFVMAVRDLDLDDTPPEVMERRRAIADMDFKERSQVNRKHRYSESKVVPVYRKPFVSRYDGDRRWELLDIRED